MIGSSDLTPDPGTGPCGPTGAGASDWAAVLQHLPTAAALWDAQDRLVQCNAEFERLYAPDRITQRQQVHCGATGPTLHCTADGRWLRQAESQLPDGRVLMLIIDTTDPQLELQQARRELAAAQRISDQLRQAIEAMPAGVELWGADERLIACNSALERLYPKVAPLLQPGQAWEALVRANHAAGALPVPAAELDDYIARRRQHRRGPGAAAVHATGDGRWIRTVESPTRDGGLVCVRIDISELKAQEAIAQASHQAAELAAQRLVDAIEALPEGFAFYDADDRLVACNERYRELYRPSAPAMTLGTPFEDILRYGLARGQYPQACGHEEAWLSERLHKHRNPDGPQLQELPGNRWLRIDERRTRDGGLVGVRTDVTELVRHEQRLVALNHQLDQANAQLATLSETDALTGLANRRLFDRQVAEEWSRMAGHGLPLALLMVDVDHFKRYNDRCGHQAGDQCLHQVAQLLMGCARRTGDVVARYGGEEFAMLLTNTPLDAALARAQAVIQAIDAACIPHPDSPTAAHLSLSIGIAVASQGQQGQHAQLIHVADQALYRAKSMGRHRAELGKV